MTRRPTDLRERLQAMRRGFDESFAAPPAEPADAGQRDLLLIRVGAEPYALHLSELRGLEAQRKIVPIAGGDPALMGLAGVRGQLVAVYNLARILGLEPAGGQLPWMVVCDGQAPVALAFTKFDGYARVPETQLHPVPQEHRPASAAGEHLLATLRTGDEVRYVLNTASVVRAILARAGPVAEATRR